MMTRLYILHCRVLRQRMTHTLTPFDRKLCVRHAGIEKKTCRLS